MAEMTKKEEEHFAKKLKILKGEPVPPRLQIAATGAICEPVKLRDPVTGKFIQWAWMVTEFVDDSYLDRECVNPVEFPKTAEHFILPDGADYDDYAAD